MKVSFSKEQLTKIESTPYQNNISSFSRSKTDKSAMKSSNGLSPLVSYKTPLQRIRSSSSSCLDLSYTKVFKRSTVKSNKSLDPYQNTSARKTAKVI
jgi:hypothetical protein